MSQAKLTKLQKKYEEAKKSLIESESEEENGGEDEDAERLEAERKEKEEADEAVKAAFGARMRPKAEHGSKRKRSRGHDWPSDAWHFARGMRRLLRRCSSETVQSESESSYS